MNTRLRPAERAAWIAAVAVLGIGLSWLGLIDLALLLHVHAAGLPQTLVALGAVLRSVLALAAVAWPALPLALLAGWLAAALVRSAGMPAARVGGRARD